MSSCVFGNGDLAELLIRPELIAHKFHLDIEPSAYFCLYEIVRRRALNYKNQAKFQGNIYKKLLQIQMPN